jgi:hypothetical protein
MRFGDLYDLRGFWDDKMARAGNDPKRRIVEADRLSPDQRKELARQAVYTGSGYHKLRPAVYNFGPTGSPRPTKSVCDGIRVVPKDEAQQLLTNGIMKGMISEPPEQGLPTYVWSVDGQGEVYEAKTHSNNQGQYHGYRLEESDAMRHEILKTWKQR